MPEGAAAGGDHVGSSGGQYAPPLQYAYVRSDGAGGQGGPFLLTPAGGWAEPLLPPAPSMPEGLFYSAQGAGGGAFVDDGEPPPPALPASLYDTTGPEDPALVAQVQPAAPLSPPGGVGWAMGPPAESFSDDVDVDALFRHTCEETTGDRR